VVGHGLEHPLHGRGVGDVGGHRERLAAFGADRGNDGLGALPACPGVDRHGKPVAGEALGDHCPESAAGAGDERDVRFTHLSEGPSAQATP
jgi:hypothetical protein